MKGIMFILLAGLIVLPAPAVACALAAPQAPPAPSATGMTEEEVQAVIRRLYREILHRDPDPSGLRTYTTAMMFQDKDEPWLRTALLKARGQERLLTWKKRKGLAFGLSLVLSIAFALLVRRSLSLSAPSQKAVFYTIAAVPALVYLFLVVQFATNIPFEDDYDDILAFLNLPPSERFSLSAFFAQHNEHRVFVTRVFAQVVSAICGTVDLRFILLLNNLALVGIALLLSQVARAGQIALPYFAPTMLFVFLTQMYGPMMRPSAQHHLVLFFAFLSLVLWNRRGLPSALLSMGAAFLATYSSGQGMFVYFPLLIWSTLAMTSAAPQDTPPQRDLSGRLLLVLICSTGFIGAYFHGYTSHASGALVAALAEPWHVLHFFVVVLGGYLHNLSYAPIAGWGAIAFFLFLTSQRYFRTRPVLYFFLLYLFLVAGAGAVTRHHWGIEYALLSKFRNLSILVLVCSYLAFLDLSTQKLESMRRGLVPTVAAVFFFFNVFFVHKAVLELSWHRLDLIEGMRCWRATGMGLSYPNQERATAVLQEAIRLGVYRIPESASIGPQVCQ